MACSSKELLVIYLVLSLSCWNSEILHAIYSSLQLILLFMCLVVPHHGVLYSVFVIAFTSCCMSHRGLLHSLIRQVGRWCWSISVMYPVSITLAAPQSHIFALLQSHFYQNIKHSLSENLQSSKLSSLSSPQYNKWGVSHCIPVSSSSSPFIFLTLQSANQE